MVKIEVKGRERKGGKGKEGEEMCVGRVEIRRGRKQ